MLHLETERTNTLTYDERQLLTHVATYAAQQLEAEAEKKNTTSNWAAEMRRLLSEIATNLDFPDTPADRTRGTGR